MRIGEVYFCFFVFVTGRSCRNIVTCLTDDTNDLPSGVDLVAFVGEGCRLSGDDLKVGIDAAFLAIGEELEGFLRRDHCTLPARGCARWRDYPPPVEMHRGWLGDSWRPFRHNWRAPPRTPRWRPLLVGAHGAAGERTHNNQHCRRPAERKLPSSLAETSGKGSNSASRGCAMAKSRIPMSGPIALLRSY